MGTILVGYDGSATSASAVAEACQLSRGLGSDLHVVAVVDGANIGMSDIGHDVEGKLVRDARVSLDRLVNDSELFKGVVTHTDVLLGPAAGKLVERAAELDADIVVVGNRRVQGLDRLLGSVALNVVRHAPCSVYVAHTT